MAYLIDIHSITIHHIDHAIVESFQVTVPIVLPPDLKAIWILTEQGKAIVQFIKKAVSKANLHHLQIIEDLDHLSMCLWLNEDLITPHFLRALIIRNESSAGMPTLFPLNRASWR